MSMRKVRKLVMPLVLVSLLFATGASTAGAATTDHNRVRVPVSFTLTPAVCPELLVTVVGTGEAFLVSNQIVMPDGSTKIIENAVANGTAVDSNGATYVFTYANHFVRTVPPGGFPVQVSMADQFNLNGKGNANNLHVGFNWHWTYNPPAESWPPIDNFVQVSSRGNPFACDPI